VKGVFPCSYELWAYGDQQCPCDPDLHAVAASSLFPAALSEPGSCRMGPHGAAGRVLERRSLPPGEMFSPLYGTGCTTLCAMSAPVQEKQTALSQLPARLLPPAVRASPAPCVPKSICWRRHQFAAFGSHSSTAGASRRTSAHQPRLSFCAAGQLDGDGVRACRCAARDPRGP
jgi:hypothetical protein